ncbi:hypothetical protein BC827DRAFT_587885 [Russula dissimulans]|nr:hypothetical protein BC827DRAFT_587885 [Russula dissimulans]
MSFRSRRATMRPAREFNVVLRARDKQVNTLQDDNDTLKVQLEAFERRLTNARANAYADARAQQLQERKIEQLREKLHDSRGGSAALRRELEDARRESETQRVRLEKADGENLRHRARITELEAALQVKSSQVLTSDVEHHDVEFEGVSRDDILDVLAQVAIDLEAVARMTEEFPSFDKPSESVPRATRANRVEMGIQTIPDGVLRPTSEQDQRRIQELEVELECSRRLNEELRNAVEEERRLVQDLKTSSAQEQSRMTSLVDVARRDQEAIKVLEATVDEYCSGIDSAEAQVALLRILLEESRTFNDDLEESYNSIVACKDVFIQDLQEKVEDLAATSAWGQKREAMLHDVQDRLAAADIEILELRLELEGAQRNAVASTNRIIQLEAESSAARHRLRTAEADLRDELGVAFERVYALEDELVAAQGRLDNAESRNRQLRQELDRYVNTPTRLPNGPPMRDDIHDVNDTDSASDEGSVDTLVMDPDEHLQTRVSSGTKDVDSPVSAKQDERLSHNATPLSRHGSAGKT